MPSITWINDPSELLNRLDTAPVRIGLDTEFIRERTYWPRLALVQMAYGDEILLVDPLVDGMPQALKHWLARQDILKIMHSAGEDLVCFMCACGTVPRPLFDTQIAAALCGIGTGLGYQKLVEHTAGIVISKGETRSNWLLRPLSDAQLEYAADDVRYLFTLHDATAQALDTLHRSAWLVEDCERLLSSIEHPRSDLWLHLNHRSAQHLDGPAQQRLLRLLKWRDHYAKSRDKPRTWILDNELLTALARHPPATTDAFRQWLNGHAKAPRKLLDPLWQALNTAIPEELTMPLAKPPTSNDRKALKRLQDQVARCGETLGLPEGVLASRKHLETLYETGAWPEALEGWRKQLLEPLLSPLLAPTSSDR